MLCCMSTILFISYSWRENMPKYEIVWNKETNTIKCGSLEINSYQIMNPDNFYSKVTNGKPLPPKPRGVCQTVHINKARCDEFGTSFIAEYKHFMRLQYKAFVSDIPKIVTNNYIKVWYKDKKFPHGIVPERLNAIRGNIEVINQTIKDGNSHILPFVVFTGKTTEDLKKKYGKGLWKRLCKNSHYRNKVIEESLDVSVMVNYPTSVIKMVNTINGVKHTNAEFKNELANWYTNYFKGKWTTLTHEDIIDSYNCVRDTKQMAGQLGYEFKLNMDYASLKQLHDKYAEAIRDRQYSSEPFDWLKDIPKQLNEGDYSIVLLDNPRSIREEGDVMKHCVASYINLVYRKEYLVYSVMKNGERVSTVGYYKTNDGWEIQQQYGKYNSRVQDDAEKFIALEMLDEINENLC